jgi:hypothetical protein
MIYDGTHKYTNYEPEAWNSPRTTSTALAYHFSVCFGALSNALRGYGLDMEF